MVLPIYPCHAKDKSGRQFPEHAFRKGEPCSQCGVLNPDAPVRKAEEPKKAEKKG